jgi:folate-dependent phosphoribosylglycinamide formyltransferase PurN
MPEPTEERVPLGLGPVEGRPIRVVLFGGGPGLERGVADLLCRLQDHPDIELAGAVVQSPGRGAGALLRDLWKRRRWLAPAVLAVQLAGTSRRWLAAPRTERRLRRRMRELASRVTHVGDIHAPGTIEHVRSLEPDLGLVYGSPILKPELFEAPALGTLGIHHGKMPEYRGKKTTFWAMYRGEETAGVTIQRIGKGLDTGAIVQQGAVPIGRRSHGRVWDDVEALGVDLYVDAVVDIKHGAATCVRPTGRKGKLYRDPKLKHLLRFYRRRWTRA